MSCDSAVKRQEILRHTTVRISPRTAIVQPHGCQVPEAGNRMNTEGRLGAESAASEGAVSGMRRNVVVMRARACPWTSGQNLRQKREGTVELWFGMCGHLVVLSYYNFKNKNIHLFIHLEGRGGERAISSTC